MKCTKSPLMPVMGQPVWISRWVLTHGILETVVTAISRDQVGIVIDETSPHYREDCGSPIQGSNSRLFYIYPPNWHLNKDDAIRYAKKRLLPRIAKAKLELAHLEELLRILP